MTTSGPSSGPNVSDGENEKAMTLYIAFRSSVPLPPFLAIHIIESNSHCPIEFFLLMLVKMTSWDNDTRDDMERESADDNYKWLVYWLLVVSWTHMSKREVIKATHIFCSLDRLMIIAAQNIMSACILSRNTAVMPSSSINLTGQELMYLGANNKEPTLALDNFVEIQTING